jgi:hypothetical protein
VTKKKETLLSSPPKKMTEMTEMIEGMIEGMTEGMIEDEDPATEDKEAEEMTEEVTEETKTEAAEEMTEDKETDVIPMKAKTVSYPLWPNTRESRRKDRRSLRMK